MKCCRSRFAGLLRSTGWRVAQVQVRGYSQKRHKPTLMGPMEWIKADRQRWRPDQSFDAVIKREEELDHLLFMKDILANTPGMQMGLQYLRIHRWDIGLMGNSASAWLGRYPTMFQVGGYTGISCGWLGKYPTIFQVNQKESPAAWFEFTPEAREQVAREKQFWIENEGLLVNKVRKLLMMAPGRRLSLDVIGHLKKPIGLPEDFRTRLVHKHPEFFKVVEEGGETLELTHWDPELAVNSFYEMTLARAAPASKDGRDQKPKDWMHWMSFDKKKSNLNRKQVLGIVKFHQAPFVSPYDEKAQDLDPQSVEAERHAVAVLYELLSLTLRKRILVDRLSHFRKISRHYKSTRSLCIQHPELFYISLKRLRETAFLKEAYRNSQLIVEDPFLSAQAWVRTFMEDGRKFVQPRVKKKKKVEVVIPEGEGGTEDAESEEDGDDGPFDKDAYAI